MSRKPLSQTALSGDQIAAIASLEKIDSTLVKSISEAAVAHDLPPTFLLAIAKRETDFGRGVGYDQKTGLGDRGNGYGMFQLDKNTQSHIPLLPLVQHDPAKAADIAATMLQQSVGAGLSLEDAAHIYNSGKLSRATTMGDFEGAKVSYQAAVMGWANEYSAAAGITLPAPDITRTPSITEPAGKNRLLAFGSRGADVAAAQRELGVTADGDFGKKTEHAVQEFQASHGLSADGIIGNQTRAALDTSHEIAKGPQRPAHPGSAPTAHRSNRQKGPQVFEDIGKAVSDAEHFVSNTAKTVVNDLKQSLPEITLVSETGRRPQSQLVAFHDGKTHVVGADFSQTGKLHDLGKFVSQTSEVNGHLSVTMYPKDALVALVPQSERAELVDAIKQHKTVTIGGHADGSLRVAAHDTPSQTLADGHARSANRSRGVGGLAD